MADSEVRVGFRADTGPLTSGMQAAAEQMRRQQAATVALSEDTRKLDDALTKYMARLDPAYRGQVQLARGLELLDANMKAGNISAKQHAEMLGTVERAYVGSRAGVEAHGKSTGLATWQIQAFTHSIRASADQMMAGQDPARVLAMQIFQLGATTTGANLALFAITASILAVVGGLGYLIARAEGAERSANALRATLEATGRSGMLSAQGIEDVVHALAKLPGISRSSAEEIVSSFVRTRQISGQLFESLISIVNDYAYATGRKAPEAAKELAKAFADPAEGAKALDKELGILSAAQVRSIEQFDRQGQRAKAQQVLLDALNERVKGLAKDGMTDLQNATNGLGQAWDRMLDSMGKTGPIETARAAMTGLLNSIAAMGGSYDALIARKAQLEKALESPADPETYAALAYELGKINAQISAIEAARPKGTANPAAATGGGASGTSGGESSAVKDALAASTDLKGVEERRAELNDRILRLKQALAAATGQEADILRSRILEAEKQRDEMKGKGDASRVDAMRAELEALKVQDNSYLDYSKRSELEFWESKLTTLRRGSADYAQVYREAYNLRKAIAKEDHDKEIADLRAQAEVVKKDGAERVRLAQEIATKTGQAYGQESVQFKQAMREVEAAQREHGEQMRRLKTIEIDTARAHQESLLAIERDNIELAASMGSINGVERVQQLRAVEQREYQMEADALQQKLQLAQQEPEERARILAQIEQLEDQHRVRLNKSNTEEAKAIRDRWANVFEPMTNAIGTSVSAIIMGTRTIRQAVSGLATAVVGEFFSMGARVAANWIAAQLGMSAASAARATEEQTLAITTAMTSAAATKAAAGANLMAHAGEGASAAMASVAAIPYVGWAMAPGVGAEHFAIASSYMASLAVPSAAGGWEVPKDTLAMVHQNEMILPASISDHIRASMQGGAPAAQQPVQVHFNVSAMDGASVASFFRANSGALMKTINSAVRNGAKVGKA